MAAPLYLQQFFDCPIPSELWHYTSVAGLKGILESTSVWATEAHFTKDASEFIHAKQIAQEYLKTFKPTDQSDEIARQRAIDFVAHTFELGALSTDISEVFVASFSSAEDLKSQWSEFADSSRGVCLAFDLRNVRPPAHLQVGVTMAPCLYQQKDKEALVESALSSYMSTAASLLRRSKDRVFIGQELRTWSIIDAIYGVPFNKADFQAHIMQSMESQLFEASKRTQFDLLRVASHCKDQSFYQEQEWRLSLPHIKSQPLLHVEIKYRGADGKTPYIESDLFSQDKRLPIIRVMLGPLCEQRGEVEDLLKQFNYNVPMCESKIPLKKD